MALGFFTHDGFLGNDLESQVQVLEDEASKINTTGSFFTLPSPATLPDGELIYVTAANALGQPALFGVVSGQWQLIIPATPTVSFVAEAGAGVGELPEDLTVATATDGVLGSGWSLVSSQTLIRPSGIATTPVDLTDIQFSSSSNGLWRMAVCVSVEFMGTGSHLHQFFMQRHNGASWEDFGPELFRFEVDGGTDALTGKGVGVNLLFGASERIRFVVRHDHTGDRDYRFHAFGMIANQFAGTPA